MFSVFGSPEIGEMRLTCVNREHRQAARDVRSYNEGDGFFDRNTFGKSCRHGTIEFSDTTGSASGCAEVRLSFRILRGPERSVRRYAHNSPPMTSRMTEVRLEACAPIPGTLIASSPVSVTTVFAVPPRGIGVTP